MRAKGMPYVCPRDKTTLRLSATSVNGDEVRAGELVGTNSARYPINDGIPDFVKESELQESDVRALRDYEQYGRNYDQNLPIIFQTIGEDELINRRKIVAKLALKGSERVLEVGCGSGRDTELIAKLLDHGGELYAQDLSLQMLRLCQERMQQQSGPSIEFARANGSALPFPDDYFDAVFHFGGLNTFAGIGTALDEFARVTRAGGKVLVGDEGVAPWLRSSLMGKILMHNVPLFECEAPLTKIPLAARNVTVEWVFGGFFYVIDFEVAKAEPQYNIDIPLPHGGTNRTRYFGDLGTEEVGN